MMDKTQAGRIGYFVNHYPSYSTFLEIIQSRIDYHRGQLEIVPDLESVLKHQGAVQELRKFLSLKETAESRSPKGS